MVVDACVMVLASLMLLTLFPSEVALDLKGAGTCIETAQLKRPLEAEAKDTPLAITVTVTATASGDFAIALTIRTIAIAPRDRILKRTLVVPLADCPLVPRLVSNIVRRFVASLPVHAWREEMVRVEVAPLNNFDSVRASSPAPIRSHLKRHLRIAAGLGLGSGLVDWSPHASIAGKVDMKLTFPVQITTQIRLERAALGTVGVGKGFLTSGSIGLGLSHDLLQAENLVIVPEALILGGFQVASGDGFTSDRDTVVGLVDLQTGLTLHTPNGPFAALYLGIPLIVPQLIQTGSEDAAAPAPRIKLSLVIGYSWDVGVVDRPSFR